MSYCLYILGRVAIEQVNTQIRYGDAAVQGILAMSSLNGSIDEFINHWLIDPITKYYYLDSLLKEVRAKFTQEDETQYAIYLLSKE